MATRGRKAPQPREEERVAPLGEDDVRIVPADPPVEGLQEVRGRIAHEGARFALHGDVEGRPAPVVRVGGIAVASQMEDHQRRRGVLPLPGRLERRDPADHALRRRFDLASPEREEPMFIQVHLR